MGIAGKHVLKTFGEYEDIKVRFAGVVIPGQTLITEMWKEGNKVIFGMSSLLVPWKEADELATKVKETGRPALSNAAVTLKDGGKAKL
jgi:multifunctional beta-oxidation protein